MIGKKVECEIHQAAGDRPAVSRNVLFIKMETAHPRNQYCRIIAEFVRLAGRRIVKPNCPIYRIAQIDLAVDNVLPGRGQRIFKIRHEDFDVRIKRIDDHLAVDGSGDLNAPVEKVFGYLEEKGVPAQSTTETYATLKLYIDNWRWRNVPFYLRTGKRMAKDSSLISIR